MQRRRTYAVAIGTVGLLAALLGVDGSGATASPAAERTHASGDARTAATLPADFHDVTAIGGLSQPVAVAFAGDGTAFIGLQTGDIKSFDFDAASNSFEPYAASTDFADLSVEVNNYGDRGLTGIAVDPQFPARPYVYVNYTYNLDPTDDTATVPTWGTPGMQYDDCPAPASLAPPAKGCPVQMRVSRLTAQRGALGWEMLPGSEVPLLQAGCFQFDSHTSGDVLFGPDGKLYASAGEGASYKGTDYGQGNNPCPDDPADEGGALRAQDLRTPGDPLDVDGTIFRLNPDGPALTPTQATADQWMLSYGQRNPWRLTFRPGTTELWSVDVGSSSWEEINRLPGATSTAAPVNRGWPCYEGATGSSTANPNWAPPTNTVCQNLIAAGPGAVQAPYFSYPGRTGAAPLTPGENCGPVVSSTISGVTFTPAGTDWPAAYQGSLYFSDFLRRCIWRLGKLPNGDPDPSSIQVFAQQTGAPVDLVAGPGGDLYYVDYGLDANGVVQGGGGVHRIQYVEPRSQLTVKSAPKKVKIKVDGKKQPANPYRADLVVGTTAKLVAPRSFVKKGLRYVFSKWKGVAKHKAKRKQTLTIGAAPIVVKAVYKRA